MIIKTSEDWWKTVDTNWYQLFSIIADKISFSAMAHESPGENSSPMTMRNIGVEVVFLKENRDSKLARYFSAAWCMSSDAYAWSVPGWEALCDLCSEEWVLHEDI